MTTAPRRTGAPVTALRRFEAWARPRFWVGDTALAALVAAPLVPASAGLVTGGRVPGHWAAGLLAVIAVLHVAPAGRRTWPRATFAVVAAAELVLALAPDVVTAGPQPAAYAPILLPSSAVFLVALYACATYGRRPAPGAALAVGIVGAGITTARLSRVPDVAPGTTLAGPWQIGLALAALLAAIAAAWALGLFRRMRAAYVDALEDRTRRAEAERDERARAAVREERARIAREMHDVVAHSLAVIVRQADAGRFTAQHDPVLAQVLTTVATTGREALSDMRALVGVLRRDDTSAGDEESSPQPTLDDLGDLVDGVRSAGLVVDFCEHGAPAPLSRAAGLAAYRLVQEALTNVVKHAAVDATARVRLDWDAGGLTVTVTDTGGGRPVQESHGGHGLIGMRERLRLAGGDLVAGPGAEGGFVVRGRLPARTDRVQEGAK